MKRLVTAAVGAAALLGVSVSSASAAPVACTGPQTSSTISSAVFNASTNACSIDDAQFITYFSMGIFVDPKFGPDIYRGLTSGSVNVLPLSFVVNGINGVTSSTFLDVVQNLNGTFLATLISAIPSYGTYKMTASFTADGGSNITINSATVSAVPIPAGAWLLLSALGGLGFAGWRRKKAVAA